MGIFFGFAGVVIVGIGTADRVAVIMGEEETTGYRNVDMLAVLRGRRAIASIKEPIV